MNNLDNYIVLNVVEVQQLQTGIVFTGKIRFNQLNQVFKLTERKESIDDPFGDEKINFVKEDEEFQRQLNDKKLREIQDYLYTELEKGTTGKSLGMFPSSLILYNRSYESDDLVSSITTLKPGEKEIKLTEEIIRNSYSDKLDCCFYILDREPDIYKLYIPKNERITLIVDGQHRFSGTKLLYERLKKTSNPKLGAVENFEFIFTYLVGFDLYEVGQIFATVNFKQKPVNRSLYYDIFGSAPQTDAVGNLQNDIRLAHDLALHLNNSDSSPIKGMIKLLGKGNGMFSQAFFVSNMLRVFRSGIWNSFVIDYLNNGKDYKTIATFMKAFLSALHEAYPSAWPKQVDKDGQLVYSTYYYDYILCKTTGLGAFFRLIRFIYPKVKDSTSDFKANLLNIFQQINDEEARRLFAKSGSYGGAGSEGVQDKLAKYLKDRLKL